MAKKEKAEAKRARRNQRKLELETNANHTDGVQDVDVKEPEADSTNSADSSK